MRPILKFFRWDLILTAAGLVAAFIYGGPSASALTAILIVVEVVFSFDNAAVNAKYLTRLNRHWQTLFLTAGVLVAVFGMRLIFPLLVVSVSGHVSPMGALSLALQRGDPGTAGTYGNILSAAHPGIAAFGGIFLLMLFLDFLFDTDREVTWLTWVERPLMKAGRLSSASALVSCLTLLLVTTFIDHNDSHVALVAGLAGMATYLGVSGLAIVMEASENKKDAALGKGISETVGLAGKAALSLFIFIEVLDASFSFDGVIGAFAITPDPIIIALGLGIGALYVRSMTIYLVRKGTLVQYAFLEHGAHWAIGALAVLMILTLKWEIPNLIIGFVGIGFISAAWATSVRANRRASRLVEAEEVSISVSTGV
jgi:uncharacterized protein